MIRAAGVVLLRDGDTKREVLVVHRPHHDDWSLPKGKLEDGESIVHAAVRECVEETGIRPVLGPRLPTQHYQVLGKDKSVDYWLARIGQDHGFEPNKEVSRIRWWSLAKANRRLTYSRDRELVAAASRIPDTRALVVLRHTRSVKRRNFRGKDARRPLSGSGKKQAETVAAALEAYGVTAIHSSDWRRCTQTVKPYADRTGTEVVEDPAFNEEAHEQDSGRARAAAAKLAQRGEDLVLCGHRPVLPTILEAVRDLAGVDRSTLRGTLEMGGMIVVHRTRNGSGRWTVVSTERHEDA